MIIDPKKTIAYICPYCSQLSAASLDAFSIPQKERLNAMCGFHANNNVCASIGRGRDKYIIDIKCPVCEEVHTFRIAEKSFWRRELVIYQCPDTDVNIFYLGDEKAVGQAIDEYEEFLEEAEDDYFSDEFDDEASPRQQALIEVMLNYLRALKNMHELLCVCGGENIYISGKHNEISLSCRRCGRTKTIAATERNLNLLLYRKPVIIE